MAPTGCGMFVPWRRCELCRALAAGEGTGQLLNRIFERHRTNTALDGGGPTTLGSTTELWAVNGNTNNEYAVTAV